MCFSARLLACSVLIGCQSLSSSYDIAPNGLNRAEFNFRRQLSAGHADSALLQLNKPIKKSSLPGDSLLRLLFEGVAAHYSGDYARSASVFDRASVIADDRSIKSIGRGALSVMVSDLSLAYELSRTERLLLPYYAALTYFENGNVTEAAVEARRLSALLQSLDDRGDAPDPHLTAFFHYFAGVVFEAAGQRNDADVAYRNAYALDAVSLPPRADTFPDSAGDVVVLVEHGFAPHRVQESLIVALGNYERRSFENTRDEDERRRASDNVTTRVLDFADGSGPRVGEPHARTLFVPAPVESEAARARRHERAHACHEAREHDRVRAPDSTATAPPPASGPCDDDDDDHTYFLRLSWPVMYAPARNYHAPALTIDSTTVIPELQASVADAVLADFRGEQPAIVARAVARAAAKFALTRSAQKRAGRKNEALGKAMGFLANLGGAITEQADTRSWNLLPGTISIVRLRLPAGVHTLKLDGVGAAAVNVTAGRITVLNRRVWN